MEGFECCDLICSLKRSRYCFKNVDGKDRNSPHRGFCNIQASEDCGLEQSAFTDPRPGRVPPAGALWHSTSHSVVIVHRQFVVDFHVCLVHHHKHST